jgi:outer membrane protein assembly factor BamB
VYTSINVSILTKLSACLLALTTLLCAQSRRASDSSPRPLAPAQKNPFDTNADVQQGALLFQTHCSYCHGTHGEGDRGADLVDGIMYLTRPENEIHALDAQTGRVLWVYRHRNPRRTFNCCGKVNRGLAILDNRLFMNTLDMHILAVDAKSGRELWKTRMHDYTEAGGYAATGAPLAVKDKVIVSMAGGERGVSWFLDAYL